MSRAEHNFEQHMQRHTPPHLYIDNTWYMLTATTLAHAPFLANPEFKVIMRETLQRLVLRFGIRLKAWVILDDHYHLLLKSHLGRDVGRFVGQLHANTSRHINQHDALPGRQIWHNYWDTCVRTEAGLWTRFNYIHLNPVKHGYVQRPEDWKFSSYHYYAQKEGTSWLSDCLVRYPIAEYLSGDEPEDQVRRG
ncbi:hypothetical protein CJ255_22160 [Candidatus Viridilinea mediisalina]|uniref:Transposase IS200-like domain-containing protein n=1 Tax=Candidatus Viridilinea mediisalina TaxID=2024553 RepID=A0A2A6RCZ1_9CHLR|nr:hypothetical protein CJ255_22160 [Candidatus Viridilinea mediisalina]